MTISEVAKCLGVDISTVRFYERKGLITPARREDSKYRDYSEEDVMTLKRIMLYRKLDFSIDDIQSILSEDADVHEMLISRREQLNAQKEQLLGSLALCEKMLEDNAGRDMEVDYYLSYVYEEEQKGRTFPDIVPALDRVADNMNMEKYVGLPFMPQLLQNAFARRTMAVVAFAVLVVFPVVCIAKNIMEVAGGGSPMRLILWCMYGVMMISVFARLIGKR